MDIEKIKQQTDIVQLMGQTIQLKKSGNIYRALCPFHPEKVPSLTIYPDSQTFYCFGCQRGGDIFDWAVAFHNISFNMALQKLASGLGLPTRLPAGPPLRRIGRSLPSPLPLKFAQYWHSNLDDRRRYFHQRGFTDETIDRELWGWNGRRYTIPVWQDEPRTSPLVQMRLRKDPEEDSDLPKYLNLTGYPGPFLYNSWVLKGRKEAIIFFGEFDAQLAAQFGMAGVSPTNGMASWNPEWTVRYLKYMETIFVVPDRGEERRGWQLAKEIHAKARIIELPDFGGKDYTDFVLAGYPPDSIFQYARS